MQWITVRRLQREYALPKMLARAVAAEQWRSIVCRCCEPWIWLRRWSVSAQACWHGLGRLLAAAMLTFAAVRVRRLQRAGEARSPHGRAMGMTPFSTMVASTRVLPT